MKISIIVPIFNAEAHLKQCLNSLVQQSYADIEIVCIDDGSADRSRQILTELAEVDERIVVAGQPNSGISAARNTGLDLASGEYVMFVDSDDWLDLHTCGIASDLTSNGTVDLVLWSYLREFPTGPKPVTILGPEVRHLDRIATQEHIYRRIFGPLGGELRTPHRLDSLSTVWGKLYRTEMLKATDARFQSTRRIGNEDALFNIDAIHAAGNSAYSPECLYHYRKSSPSSFTAVYRPNLPSQWELLFDDMRNRIVERALGTTFSSALENRIALSLIGLGLNELVNPAGVGRRISVLGEILQRPTYRHALHSLNTSAMPLHWRAFFNSARAGSARGTYAFLHAMGMLAGR